MGGRPPLACMVRNFSIGGALLEFSEVPPPVHSFHLKIEHVGFESLCDVRHRKDKVLGVYFPEEFKSIEATGKSRSAEIVAAMREALIVQAAN
jgi:hypothetical protein